MSEEDPENSEEKNIFQGWIIRFIDFEKKELTIDEQIKIANKKRIKAVKKQKFLKAAKYRDIIKQLKNLKK
jgi:protein-arginine kinase activator protein McsA